jgi:hypothetical protein
MQPFATAKAPRLPLVVDCAAAMSLLVMLTANLPMRRVLPNAKLRRQFELPAKPDHRLRRRPVLRPPGTRSALVRQATLQNERVERKKVMPLAQVRKIEAVLVTEPSRWGRST